MRGSETGLFKMMKKVPREEFIRMTDRQADDAAWIREQDVKCASERLGVESIK
jgi:hypothetical protein